MQLRTILNHVHKVPVFVFGKIRLLKNNQGEGRLEVDVRPHARSHPSVRVCGMPGPG